MARASVRNAVATGYTSLGEVQDIHRQLTQTFATGKTRQIRWRKWQLKQLWWMLDDNEAAIAEAMRKDLSRHEMEAVSLELLGARQDILYHLEHLEEWAADEPVPGAGFVFGRVGKARIRKEPLGLVLVIGTWNLPFLVVLLPVIAAIAAGCTVMIKPSEMAVASQNLLAELLPKYLDPEAISLVTGGPDETTEILKLKFNHILFTGSGKVGRVVATAAAQHLTPTILELGGQTPAVIGTSADYDLAAKRIAYGKFINAGQVCLAVNHVFVDPSIHDKFVERLLHWTKTLHGGGTDETHLSTIINERNHGRLSSLVQQTDGVVHRVQAPKKDSSLFMAPVVATDLDMNDSLLSEELFGPICPVIKATVEDAVQKISQGPHPLGIYIFSKEKAEINYVLDNTTSGGVTINDVFLHYGTPGAPFGGVGESGHGYYHGKYGFMAFSHQRTVLELPTWMDRVMSFRYPPFALADRDKLIPPLKAPFKRGETMEDQSVGTKGLGPGLKLGILSIAAAAVALAANPAWQGRLQALAERFSGQKA